MPYRYIIENMQEADMIVMDIEMPEMDGFEALKRLKGTPSLADIPVIFLTGTHKAAALGFQLSIADFITKPVCQPLLLNRIKTHLHIVVVVAEIQDQFIAVERF